MGYPHLFGIALSVIATLAIVCSVILILRLRAIDRTGREMQRMFDLFGETACDYSLWVLGPEGRIRHWNSGAERLHGYGAAEMIGRHCSILYTEQDRSAHLPQRLLEQAARQGRCATTGARVRKQGAVLAVESVLHALRDEAGQLTGFCEIERDVSERAQREQTLQQTQAALLQAHKLEAIGRLSRGVAHDFNNVVQVIKNCVRVLQRGLADRPQLLQFIEMIERNADRAATLSQHLLGFAHREPGESTTANVDEVVAEAVELLRHTLGEGIVLEHQLGSSQPWTSIDRVQLEAALLNLAADARDAMPGAGKISIHTGNAVLDEAAGESGSDSAQYVTIRISRVGPHAASAPAAPALAAGPSFALTQIRQILERVGGRVEFEPYVDGDSSVTLWLPCAHAPSEQAAHGATRPPTVASGAR